ncbi:MAG TPA: hypothetical protein ENN21_11250 [Spirochaetes bacterium]|nr:hypothetical protein [Spirochaetota bacterium]
MWDKVYYFVMVPMVYIAFGTFALGIILKLLKVLFSPSIKGSLGAFPRKAPMPAGILYEVFAMPAVFKKDKVLWIFLMAYHAAFGLLVLGHLELIREFRFLQIVPHEVFLGAGWVGIVLTISVLYFLLRRFRSPYREISVPEDYLLLLLLFLTFVFGSHMHLAARYGIAGFDIPLDDYRAYLSSMVNFKPELPAMITASPHYVIIMLHILFANLFLMLFPFSKMIHSVFVFFTIAVKRK